MQPYCLPQLASRQVSWGPGGMLEIPGVPALTDAMAWPLAAWEHTLHMSGRILSDPSSYSGTTLEIRFWLWGCIYGICTAKNTPLKLQKWFKNMGIGTVEQQCESVALAACSTTAQRHNTSCQSPGQEQVFCVPQTISTSFTRRVGWGGDCNTYPSSFFTL